MLLELESVSFLLFMTTWRDRVGREVEGGIQDGRDPCMYTYGRFTLMYGKNHHNIVIILQLKEETLGARVFSLGKKLQRSAVKLEILHGRNVMELIFHLIVICHFNQK